MSARPVDVLSVMQADREAATEYRFYRTGEFTVEQYIDGMGDSANAYAAVTALVAAARSNVALTFAEGMAADDAGAPLLYCNADKMNPCWSPSMPITAPLRHWGWTHDADGEWLACRSCQLRAALAAFPEVAK